MSICQVADNDGGHLWRKQAGDCERRWTGMPRSYVIKSRRFQSISRISSGGWKSSNASQRSTAVTQLRADTGPLPGRSRSTSWHQTMAGSAGGEHSAHLWLPVTAAQMPRENPAPAIVPRPWTMRACWPVYGRSSACTTAPRARRRPMSIGRAGSSRTARETGSLGEPTSPDVKAFLTRLAMVDNVSAST